MSVRRGLTHGPAVTAVAALALSLLPTGLAIGTAIGTAGSASAAVETRAFSRLATYPVFQNVPTGVDPDDPTVAEISDVSDDGNTVVYTDALGKRIGFLDISDPGHPVGAGTLALDELGDADDQPTSVAVVGDYVLVVVDTSGGDFTDPSGRLDVVRLSDHTRVRSIDLGGQPDSIAISKGEDYAAIAMENQRDEELAPEGGEEGDLPQLPAGFVQVVDLAGAGPDDWTAHAVPLVDEDGSALASFVAAGLDTPEDPEPEYVDINDDDKLALTLQENNGVVIIDLATRAIDQVFSAGIAHVEGVDTEDDGAFDATGTIDSPREPDAIQWVGDDLVATANEGDWKGGSRGWSVFDTTDGSVVWDAARSFEDLATRYGLHNEDRAGKKGPEAEGMAFDVVGGTPYAFVGSERSNFVAVYDMTDPTDPGFRQVLPATNGPEGILPVPSRDLLVVSSEEDDASAGVRASVGVYRLGDAAPSFPTILAGDDAAGHPIGWGALGSLTGVPGEPDRLYAASDAAYSTGRIYGIDVGSSPAVIDEVTTITEADGDTPAIDVEGLFARPQGGFWLGVEGATGGQDLLALTDDDGDIQRKVYLPRAVRSHLGKWGIEGVTATGSGRDERVYVAIQRPLWVDGTDPKAQLEGDVARIGRYDVADGSWTWFGYRLQPTSTPGDWMGLSEIVALDDNSVAVVERDKLQGTRAAVKRVYTVDLPAGRPGAVTRVTKHLAVDVLPELRAFHGWTQEKLEGLGYTSNGRVFAITDNDGLADATGETQLMELGSLRDVFADSLATSTGLAVSDRRLTKGARLTLKVSVRPGFAAGRVAITDRGRTLRTLTLAGGRASVSLKPGVGRHRYVATYRGSATATGSASKAITVTVTKKKHRHHGQH